MYHKIVFWGAFLFLFAGIVFLQRFSATNDLFQKYQKIGFVQSNFQYKKALKTWDGQGLIFYQVQFPRLPFTISAQKVLFSFDEQKIKFDLKNVHFNTYEILKKLYGEKLLEKLNTYVPYKDFERKLWLSLALMDVNDFEGNISILVNYFKPKELEVTIKMEKNHQDILSFSGIILRPIEGTIQFSDIWAGKVKDAQVYVDSYLLKKYAQYAKSRGISPPENMTTNSFNLSEKEGLKLRDIFN